MSKPQISQELLLVDRSNLRDRLDPDDDLIPDYQVRAKPHLKESPLVDNGNRLLRDNLEFSLLQLALQNSYGDRFEQPWTQPHMDAISCVDDLLCENIPDHSPDSARKDAKIAKKE